MNRLQHLRLENWTRSLLVLALLTFLAYLTACTRLVDLERTAADQSVLVVGRVSCIGPTVNGMTAFELSDPTGAVYVLSPAGSPQQGAYTILWGTTSTTDADRTLLVESRRLSTF